MAYELEEVALRLDSSWLEKSDRAEQPGSPEYVQHAALRVFKRKLDETRRSGTVDQKACDKALDDLKEMVGLTQFKAVRVGQLAKELVVAHLCAEIATLATGTKMHKG